nr:reverse transcriptase domain-containing protein [Tanacetum cinerariifolium]
SKNPNPKGRNRRRSKQRIEEFNLEELSPPIVTMADQCTMAQLLQAPTEAPIWLEKEPPRSIFTWDDLVSKFINQFFPPSKTTNIHNEITNFQQRFDESFSEAWGRFKDLLQACPHNGFSELHQLDTFYNALNLKDQDSLNSAVGGNFLDKIPRECLAIIEIKSKVRYSRNKPVVTKVSMNTSTFGTFPSNTIANPTSDLKAITNRSGVSYDGPQIPPPPSFLPMVVENEPEATKDTVTPPNNESTEDVQPPVVLTESPILNSEPVNSPIIEHVASPVSAPKPNPKSSIPYPSRRNDERNHEKASNQINKFYKIFKDMSFEISFADALIRMPKFASTLKALIENKEKLSEMAGTPLNEHCSVVLLKKFPKKLRDPGKFLIPYDFPIMDEYFDADPRVPLILGISFLKTERALIDVFKGELTLRVGKEAITFNLDQTSRYSANYNDMTANRIDFIDMACEEYSQEVLGFSDVIASGNPTPYYDPIVSTTSSTLTSFGNSDFLLEEVDAFLALEDDLTSSEVDQSYLDSEGDILL